MKQIGSVITGLPSPAPTRQSSTGERRGGTGVATTGTKAVHPSPTAAPKQVTADMLTRLRSETGFSVNLRKRCLFPPTGGSYEVLDGIEVHSGVRFDQDAAIALCRDYMASADPRALIDLATLLKVSCKARGEGDEMTAAQLKVYADSLSRYPADVARAAVMKWIETERFFPALSEIHDACKRELMGRDRIEQAIRRRYAEEQDEPQRESLPVTDEFIKAMREKYRSGPES